MFIVTKINGFPIEPDKTFFLYAAGVTNAPLGTLKATATLLNDDGLPGRLDHFTWSNIDSPQGTNDPIWASLTARDVFGNFATNATAAFLSANALQLTNRIQGGLSPTGSSAYSIYSLGYSFTPNTNLAVTHLRGYGSGKISLWTETQNLLASSSFNGAGWVEIPLTNAVLLSAGTRYRLAVYTGGNAFAWVGLTPANFANGTIDQPYYCNSDSFPTLLASKFYLVDLRYLVGWPSSIAIAPTTIAGFTNGVWTGALAMQTAGAGLQLHATDGFGHEGISNPFDVLTLGTQVLRWNYSQGKAVIYWPASAPGYTVEMTDTLVPADWHPVTDAPAQAGGLFYLTNVPGSGSRYYRLKK